MNLRRIEGLKALDRLNESRVEECPDCGDLIIHGDGATEPSVYCAGCFRTWPPGTIVGQYDNWQVWGKNSWGVPMVGLRLFLPREERCLTINEGGRGIVLAFRANFFYACLWLTVRYNWRVSWHRGKGWKWRDDDES